MSHYLVAGAGGMLGTDLQEVLAGRQVTALSRSELDITDLTAVRRAVDGVDAVINCAAYTKVDDAESHEIEARAINATGAGNLAIAAAEAGARLVQVSTDYVFDGRAKTPYSEDTPRAPISAYGRTKAEGEELALAANPAGTYVVRTAWLYGAGGQNFPRTMLRAAESNEILTVVTDQLGQPTWSADLARQIVVLLDSDAPAGIYHGTSSGAATWFDLARETFRIAGLDPERIHPTTSAAYVRPAPRPAYSVLGHEAWSAAGLPPIRGWSDALHEAWNRGALR